jgi:hypothetical protein
MFEINRTILIAGGSLWLSEKQRSCKMKLFSL